MTSQVFAISGGPVFDGSTLNLVGVYSGMIVVDSVEEFQHDTAGANLINPNTGQALVKVGTSTVSLGLFRLGVPTISVATGAFNQRDAPFRFGRQPWFIEAADVHGSGQEVIFPDGHVEEAFGVFCIVRGK